MRSPATDRTVGVLLPRDLPADRILPYARRAEELGFGALWVVEDLGFRGGIAQAAAVLASTDRIRVGIGLLPAGARNVAFAALEIASLAQLFPGRVDVAVGHGMPAWMRSVGQWPRSPLTLLREYVDALRALLRGELTQRRGQYVHLDGVQLDPSALPDVVPDILAGVRGPKSLALSGEVADGTVLAEPVAPEYARAALGHIAMRPPPPSGRVQHRVRRRRSAHRADRRPPRSGVDRRARLARAHRPAPVRRRAGRAAVRVREPRGVRPAHARRLDRPARRGRVPGGGPCPSRRAAGGGRHRHRARPGRAPTRWGLWSHWPLFSAPEDVGTPSPFGICHLPNEQDAMSAVSDCFSL